jgi:hypothetical protein
VPHACNPIYSEGKDQEDCGSRSAQADRDPISKNPSKKELAEWLKVKTLSSIPSAAKKRIR